MDEILVISDKSDPKSVY